MSGSISVTVHIDGGSRGNPGPAASGVVVRANDGTVLHEAGHFLGVATNNIAEYRALVEGLRAAGELKAGEVHVVSDSELLVRQMNGQYRVKNEGLRPLYEQAKLLAAKFTRCTFRHVPREQNKHADKLVNMAINARRNVEDADSLDGV